MMNRRLAAKEEKAAVEIQSDEGRLGVAVEIQSADGGLGVAEVRRTRMTRRMKRRMRTTTRMTRRILGVAVEIRLDE